MLHFRIISDPSDVTNYGNIYEKFGLSASSDYLNQSHVRVFYRNHAPYEWLAGYAVTVDGPSRYLSVLTEEQNREMTDHFAVTRDQLVEIGGCFIKTRRISGFERLQVYSHMMWDAYRTKREYIMAGTFLVKEKEKQMRVLPCLVFDDKVAYLGKDRRLWIYFGHRNKLIIRLVSTLVQEIMSVILKLFPSPAALLSKLVK